jgi:hypothetical protein
MKGTSMALQSAGTFGRFDQQGLRRRRLLGDNRALAGVAGRAWPDEPQPRKSNHYGDAEFLDRQLRLFNLIPRRWFRMATPLMAAVGIIAGLEAAYAWMLGWIANGGASIAAIDLAVADSLGGWFAILLLLVASAVSMVVYAVRRNRVDDYQGRYRVWLWAAACGFILATDRAAQLGEAFCALLIGLGGASLAAHRGAAWLVVNVVVLGAVGARLLLDMRPCRPSVTALIAAALACGFAAAGRLGWIFSEIGGREIMFVAGADLGGLVLLAASMTIHARHVLLDAEGLLPPPKEIVDEDDDDEDDRMPVVTGRTARTAAPVVFASPASSPSPAASVSRKLTKGERKALKERLLRERLERERKGL